MAGKDVYSEITSKIIEALESHQVGAWVCPWNKNKAPFPRRSCGLPYSGVNVLVLWMAANSKGYRSAFWFTYQQAASLGAHVKKGEKGNTVVYGSSFKREVENGAGELHEKVIPFLKSYTVFNAEQIEGLPPHFYAERKPGLSDEARDAAAEAWLANVPAELRHGGSRAYYNRSQDFVQLPEFSSFKTGAGYYATRAHELVHWTGHESRNNREFGARFGNDKYAFEELIAEIGASFVCDMLGLPSQIDTNHAPYIAGWIKVLKADKRAIFTAATQAQKAAELLASYQPKAEAGEVNEVAA